MSPYSLATTTFDEAEQMWFADLSGDRNPIHIDPIEARRIQSGRPAVHGIHLLLWSLEQATRVLKIGAAIGSMRVLFSSFVNLGEIVDLRVTSLTRCECVLSAYVDTEVVCRISLKLNSEHLTMEAPLGEIAWQEFPNEPAALSLEECISLNGKLRCSASSESVVSAFPELCASWSSTRIRALLTISTLVGMICPGKYGVLVGLTLNAVIQESGENVLSYSVNSVDSRFHLVRIQIEGARVRGIVESFVRGNSGREVNPYENIEGFTSGACREMVALVIGGSRGLGERTARLLAALGAEVHISYVVGQEDAERVAASICSTGGKCAVTPYDVRLHPGSQLSEKGIEFTHLFYFATPSIFRRRSDSFVESRFEEFKDFYVTGFRKLVEHLSGSSNEMLTVLYPSTVAVANCPRGMEEYVAAKLAGEAFCEHVNVNSDRVRILVYRFPRLLTDQTATILPTETAEPTEVLKSVLQEMLSG